MSKIQQVNNNALTKQELLYVQFVTDGIRPKHAFRKAGFTSECDTFERLQALPRVQNALKAALTLRFSSDDAPAARKVIRDLMDDVGQPGKLRLECAKLLLNRGGYAELKAIPAATPANAKSLSEMTGAELQAHIAKLQGEIGHRSAGAKVIEGVILDTPPDDEAQDIDILD